MSSDSRSSEQLEREDLEKLRNEINFLSRTLHEQYLVEYLQLLKDKKKMFAFNFLIGIARGLGMAVGFTVLGAIVFFILQKLILLNMPVISQFIQDLLRLAEQQGL